MFFTSGQLCGLIIITECLIYAFLSKCLDTIKHCSSSRTFRKCLEKGTIKGYEFKTYMDEEKKKYEEK